MKKVININFQGRVIPIEETAYEMLQNYTASLRNYFATEEGRDEIINDIESRIAELFGETLKKGASCITDTEVNRVMNSIGRPEDFDQADETPNNSSANASAGYQGHTQASPGMSSEQQEPSYSKKRLYRDEEDKILAGVASGLAHYLQLDPAVIRIVFALLAIFGGSGFLIYIILWIVLPSRSLVTNVRKRLYRDPDDRVISGVCGGLAKYFNINPAIPRVFFAAPFIFGIITSIFRSFYDPGLVIIGSFGGGTFILAYIILWIVLPEAHTASEKLEMRGEKVDLNSIRNTVMDDLQGVKGRAEKMGKEVKETAQRFGSEMGERSKDLAAEMGQIARQNRGGIGNALVILVKAFLYLIGGAIAIGLFIALIALLGSGIGVLPLRDFLLQGSYQNLFAWGVLLLFIGVPIVGILVWFVRRLMKVKTNNKYIGYAFTLLWLVGLFCVIGLIASLSRSFSSQVAIRKDTEISQPSGGKLLINMSSSNISYSDNWFDFDGVISADNDSLYLNTVRVNIIQSSDTAYHVHLVKISKGHDRQHAQALAEKIDFPFVQQDSLLYLPETFTVSKNDKWRNQRVLVVIEVPVGKKVRIDEKVEDYEYFSVDFGRRRNWRVDWDRKWEDGEDWITDKDMLMTPEGLEWKGRADEYDGRYPHHKEEEWNEGGEQKIDTPIRPEPPAAPAKPKAAAIKTAAMTGTPLSAMFRL